MSEGLGQVDTIAAMLAPQVSSLVEKAMPQIQAAFEKLQTQAEPMVRRIISEDVLPRVETFGTAAILGGTLLAALVGAIVSEVASRKRGRG